MPFTALLTARALEAAEAVGGFGGAAAGLGGLGADGAGSAEQVAAAAQQFEALGSGLAEFEQRSETAAQAVDRLAKSTAGSGDQARAMGEDVAGARGEVDDFAAAGKKTGDEVTKIFERAGEGIKQSFADSFAELIEKGRFSFDRLAKSVRDIFKKLALELARTLIVRPVLGSIAGAFGLNALVPGQASAGGIGGGTGGGGFSLPSFPSFSGIANGIDAWGATNIPGLFGSAPSQAFLSGPGFTGSLTDTLSAGFAPTTGPLASIGLGNILGGIGAVLPGLMAGNFAQAGFGLGGYVLGTALTPVLGPLGPILGGFLGNTLGGLFGRKKPSVGPYGEVSFGTTSTDTGHPAYNATTFDPRSLNLIGYGGDNGFARDEALRLGEGLRGSFNRTMRGLGGTLRDVRDVEIIHARQGKEGFTISGAASGSALAVRSIEDRPGGAPSRAGSGIASKTFQDYGAAEAYFVAQGLKSTANDNRMAAAA